MLNKYDNQNLTSILHFCSVGNLSICERKIALNEKNEQMDTNNMKYTNMQIFLTINQNITIGTDRQIEKIINKTYWQQNEIN